jgi:hypothetical protein
VRGRAAVVALGLACAALAPAAARAEDPLASLRFDRYHDAAELERVLRAIAAAYPGWTRLEEMGRSREDRPLWVLSVHDPSGPDPASRPAMYVDGNTHGNELQGTEICLFTVAYLLERARTDPWVGALVKRVTFHVAPCVNPDARERFLHAATTEHAPRGVLRPFDDDRDGAVDEDPPNDLDGDGEILQMRVRDPNGTLVVDEEDDRLLRPRRADEPGGYRMVGTEGIDDDGDGEVNEDGVGQVDPNRNWPTEWRSEGVQRGAGPYPLSEPETRATALFVIGHPRIAAVQSFHNAGEMILRPPASRRDADVGFPAEDRAVFDELARRGGRLLPGYRYLQIREGLYNVHGGFVDWTFSGLGVFSFTNEVWGNIGAGEDPRAQDLDRLRWNDDVLHGAGFVRWKEVRHPALGTVEVGGWRRFTLRNTPADFLPDLCLRNARFVVEHAAAMPDLAVAEATLQDGGRRVRVVLENRALFPTISAWAHRHRLVPPDEVEAVGGAVLAAVEVVPAGPSRPLPIRRGRARLEDGLPGRSRRTLDLFVDPSRPPSSILLSSRQGGVASARCQAPR